MKKSLVLAPASSTISVSGDVQNRSGVYLTDNRPSSVLQQKSLDDSSVAQLATKIKYKTGSFKYGKNLGSNQIVGIGMEADLDPSPGQHRTGSAPGSEQKKMMDRLHAVFPESKMVRGHLLNGNLGGLGLAENLYPITTQANKQHEKQVENHVKKEIEKGNMVNYKVNVIGRGDTEKNAAATFECEVRKGGKMIIQKDISSIPGAAASKRAETTLYEGNADEYDKGTSYKNADLAASWQETGKGTRGEIKRSKTLGSQKYALTHDDGTVYGEVNS